MPTTVGVVAVQGDVAEHAAAADEAIHGSVETHAVRRAGDIPECDVVVIPGGESTTISRLLHESGIDDEVISHAAAGKPLLATCAGLILLSREPNDARIRSLGLLDIGVDRNAFGRQRESFEAPVNVNGLTDPFPGVFIRAPRIISVGDVEVFATCAGEPVAIRDGSIVAASFHPELTEDVRFHRTAIDPPR